MGSLWAAGLLLRRIRSEWGPVLLFLVLVAATSFVFSGAPRVLNRVYDDALRHDLRTSSPVQRDLTVAMTSSMSPGNEGGLSSARSYGNDVEAGFPPSLRAVIADSTLGVSATRFYVPHPPLLDTYLTLRYQDGLTDATRLVAGRWPVDHGVLLPPVEDASGAEGSGGGTAQTFTLEAALSQATSKEIGAGVGDRLSVVVDGTDSMLRGVRLQLVPIDVLVVGVYEPLHPDGEYWAGDSSLKQATLAGTPEHPVAYAGAYIPAAMYPTLWNSGMPFHYEWTFHVDPQRIDAGQVPQLIDDVRRLSIVRGASELGFPGSVVLRTGFDAILQDFATDAGRTDSVLSIAAIGPFGLAAAAMGMMAVLLVMRRRAALALARGRGASGLLVIGAQLWEAILVAGAASVVGWLAAVSGIPARDSPLSAVLALAVAFAAVAMLVAASWPTARRPLGQLERDDPPVLRVAPRRLVVELTIVAIALGAIALLRQRGVTIEAAGGVTRFDPLMAAAPVLSGVAAGIVATRLYPVPIRSLGWLAARRRDLVPVLGLRTIGRHPAAANLPLLVLLLTAAFGAFASVIVSSLDQGQGVASYRSVGADYRLEKVGIGSLPTLNPTAIPGVEESATGIYDRFAAFATRPDQLASLQLEVVDAPAYQRVVAGSPVEPHWPDTFLAAPPAGAGTPREPIPAILSPQLPDGSVNLASGDTFRMTVVGFPLTFRLVERRDRFAGIDESSPFAIVPYRWVQVAIGKQAPLPSVMWLRGGPDVAKPLAAAIARAGGSVHVVSRPAVLEGLHGSPLGVAVVIGFGAALGVAAVYLTLTVMGALVLSAAHRTQDLAYLRVLGISPPQTLGLTIVENLPPVLVALVPGAALGIGIAFLIEPGLGLSSFVGAGNVPLFVDWPLLALMLAALIGVFAVAVAAGTWLSRRARLVNALRMGED